MTKKKLIISLCAFVLVVAIGVVGVLAATTQNVTFKTQLSFTATDVVGNVVISAQNGTTDIDCNDSAGDNINTRTLTFAHDTADGDTLVTIPAQEFEEKDGATITYTIVFNNTGDRDWVITLAATNNGANDSDGTNWDTWDNVGKTETFKVGTNDYTSGTTHLTKGQTATYTLTLTLTSAAQDITSKTVKINVAIAGTAASA